MTRLLHRAPTRWITDAFAVPDHVTEDPYHSGTEYLYQFRHYIDAAFADDPEILCDKEGKDRRDLWFKERESWEHLGAAAKRSTSRCMVGSLSSRTWLKRIGRS